MWLLGGAYLGMAGAFYLYIYLTAKWEPSDPSIPQQPTAELAPDEIEGKGGTVSTPSIALT